MVTVVCEHCRAKIKLNTRYRDFIGPVACIKCHRGTWVRIAKGSVKEAKKWPAYQKTGSI